MRPERYSYFPIDSEYLRLLKRDFSQEDGLRFTLRLVVRDPPSGIRPPRYIALSYTWGTEQATELIYLNGRQHYIRPNLWSCLNFLTQQPSVKDEWIWCDAICIDQNSFQERNSQVQLMGRTYWDALYVSVWLGARPSQRTAENKNPNKASQDASFDWEASIQALTAHPYWMRAWIVQEYMLAKDVRLWCGSNHMGWQEFHELLASKDHKSCRAYTLGQARIDGPMNRDNVSNFYRRRGRPLATLLQEHSETLCEDPRDRVFSLLGMVPGYEERLLHHTFPDYNMRDQQVALLTITHLYRHYGSRILGWEGMFSALNVKSTEERDLRLEQAKKLDAWIETNKYNFGGEFDWFYQRKMKDEAQRLIDLGREKDPLTPASWPSLWTWPSQGDPILPKTRLLPARNPWMAEDPEPVREPEPKVFIPEYRPLDAQATDDGPPHKKARCDTDRITHMVGRNPENAENDP